jgi:NAD(P)-dependent dehydrogenase (short-subunit alcohol dehydrogenase family)
MIAGRDQARASRLLDRMRAAGAQAHFVPGDISDADNCRRLLAETTSLIGPPDIVVNSAGIIYHATAEETSDSARFITGYPLVADGGSRA